MTARKPDARQSGKSGRLVAISTSILFVLATALALLLSAVLLIGNASTGFRDFHLFSAESGWMVVVVATPFVVLLLRAKDPAAFKLPSNRIFFAMTMLAVVAVHFGLMSTVI